MSTETTELLRLLNEWGLSVEAQKRLGDLKLTTIHLETISPDELQEVLPLEYIADRILLKRHLDIWRLNLKQVIQTANTSSVVSPKLPIAKNASNSPHYSSNSPHCSSKSGHSSSLPLSPSIPISNGAADDTEINSSELEAILNSSRKGKTVMRYFKDTNKLREDHRRILTNLIVDSYVSKRKIMTPIVFKSWAEEISSFFPSEDALLYYDRYGNGKLVTRHRNCRNALRCAGLLPGAAPTVTSNTEKEETPEDEYLKYQIWLGENSEPWLEVMAKWRATASKRLASYKEMPIRSTFKVWPLLKHCQANLLIDIDFSYLYPGKESFLLESWNDFTTVFIEYYNSLKLIYSDQYMKQYAKTTNKDNKDYIILMLLHSVLNPLQQVGSWRPTIRDAQQGHIVYLSDISELDSKIKQKKIKYNKLRLRLKPFLVVVGKDIFNLERFYISITNFYLKFDSLLQALDCCYKIYQLFNLEYPEESKLVWIFIQEHFFLTKNDTNNAQVSEFITKLLTFF